MRTQDVKQRCLSKLIQGMESKFASNLSLMDVHPPGAPQQLQLEQLQQKQGTDSSYRSIYELCAKLLCVTKTLFCHLMQP